MKKRCNFCGNIHFEEKVVEYIYKRDGRFLVVNNVPAEECGFCGERYFRADVLKKIEDDFNRIYIDKKKAAKSVRVPFEEFAEIA